MSLNHIVKFFSSDRTKPNGEINQDFYEDAESQYETWKNMDNPYIAEKNVLDMNKEELTNYARDTYGLKCTGMNSGNIVKRMYEHIHGVEVSNRGRKKQPVE